MDSAFAALVLNPVAASVALQTVEFGDPSSISVVTSVGSGAVGAFLTTLLVGAIMVALAPNYVEQKVAAVRTNVVGSFVYGLLSLVFVILVTVVVAITVIGLPLAILFFLVSVVLWAVGAAIGFLAVAERLVGHDDGWLAPLFVAAAINGGLALTGIGGVISFCIGAAGFGAVLRDVVG